MANILLGVTGGIAGYKAILLARLFVKNNHNVKVMLTCEAERFVTALSFEAITHNKVLSNSTPVGSISHIEIATWSDICIIAPATANSIAKIACGIADNPLTTSILALTSPLLIAPSMNTKMYQNIATQENITKLKSRGIYFIEPTSGELACGDIGIGKMSEPHDIYQKAMQILAEIPDSGDTKILAGLKILITAGHTIEDIDPVRYISNRSSGKMGLALAEVAKSMGADVKLIAGDLDSSLKFDGMIKVKSADDMFKEVAKEITSSDILLMAAAVADYKMDKIADKKIKKNSEVLELKLIKNIDILATISKDKKPNQVFVGFAAESDNLDKNALEKLKKKNLDMIVANDISRSDIGFNSDMNEVKIFFNDNRISNSGKKPKTEIAKIILTESAIIYNQR